MDINLEIPYPLQVDMAYAARFGNTDPMNVIVAMLNGIELRNELDGKLVTYRDAHDLRSNKIEDQNRQELIERSKRLSIPGQKYL